MSDSADSLTLKTVIPFVRCIALLVCLGFGIWIGVFLLFYITASLMFTGFPLGTWLVICALVVLSGGALTTALLILSSKTNWGALLSSRRTGLFLTAQIIAFAIVLNWRNL